MNKIKSLSKVLQCDIEDLKTVTIKNAWYDVEVIEDQYTNDMYLVLDNAEHYYNADMFGVDNLAKVECNEYYVYKV